MRSYFPTAALLLFGALVFLTTGACDESVCPVGQIDCGVEACVDLTTSQANCGACGVACKSDENCAAGACVPQLVCTGDFVACGGSCEDPLSSPKFCGATLGCGALGGSAGTACANGLVCANGVCSPDCPQGLVNCEGGCIDPVSSRAFCGAADGCGVDGGTAGVACAQGLLCAAGVCGLECPPNLVECDGRCVDASTSRTHCGATTGCNATAGTAGDACAPGEVCANGSCGLSCQAGMVQCGGNCVDPNTSRTHCGASVGCDAMAGTSGAVCPSGQVCAMGTCAQSCPAGLVNCNGTCIDPLSNQDFCGATLRCGTGGVGTAGTPCMGGLVCANGTCGLTCPDPLVECGGSCVDPSTSRTNCRATLGCGMGGMGSAGEVCNPGFVCTPGGCALSCPTDLGIIKCGMACVDPATNPNFCGATEGCGTTGGQAGTACGPSAACSSGRCVPLSMPSCKDYLAAFPGTPSGTQAIDPDGTGPLPEITVYCDMTYNDGTGVGGWTLIEAMQAPNNPDTMAAGTPAPGTSVYLPLAQMTALATRSTQVHIRTPGAAATASATSIANATPIANLRMGRMVAQLGDAFPLHSLWTGPFADNAHFDLTCAHDGATWPNVYQACGTNGIHIWHGHARWAWSGGNTGLNESLEVYVR